MPHSGFGCGGILRRPFADVSRETSDPVGWAIGVALATGIEAGSWRYLQK